MQLYHPLGNCRYRYCYPFKNTSRDRDTPCNPNASLNGHAPIALARLNSPIFAISGKLAVFYRRTRSIVCVWVKMNDPKLARMDRNQDSDCESIPLVIDRDYFS
jgi:hypothetical protein